MQVIATGADPEPLGRVTADCVICADGGLDVALAAGVDVDLVVGDLDSAGADALEAVAGRAEVLRASSDKDETDLELALAEARARGASRITVHLAAGGRLDHQLANLAVLASPRWHDAEVGAFVGRNRVFVVHARSGAVGLPLDRGAALAVQPMGGAARVTTRGVRWPLTDEWLDAMSARGISNEVTAESPTVQVGEGVVLVISSAQAT